MHDSNWLDVVLVDPRGIIGNGDTDTQNRQEKYQKLYETINEKKYSVITTSKKNEIFDRTNSNFIYLGRSSRFSISFLFQAVRFLKSRYKSEEILLTCSDPWESFLSVWIISKFVKAKIQIQIHADIGDPAWRALSPINCIRGSVAKFAIKKAHMIRLVDIGQLESLNQYLNYKICRADIVPVPLNLPENFDLPQVGLSLSKSKRIGFVGRMHKDRGVRLFLRHIIKLNSVRQDFEVVLIGDGAERNQLKSMLEEKLGARRVTDLGFLQGKDYYAALASLDLVMSLAPSESYGRVVRESLALGVPILAKRNTAIDNLMRENQGLGIQIIEDDESGESISKKVEIDYLKSELMDISTRIRELERESFENVVLAWKING